MSRLKVEDRRCEGIERQLIALKSSGNVYAFVYALLIQVLEL